MSQCELSCIPPPKPSARFLSPESVDITFWTRSGEIQWCGGVHVILIVTNISYFCDIIYSDMESIAQEIENKIHTFKRGRIFFPDDFLGMGTSDTIRQTLSW